ncbi:unnamed protein product [Owenia fusiformis]|uniref:Hemoglobin linker chain n=1 Tax=Owenia fusiformis TaxID=6347 RepID=A0A8S4N356_OWEFU|nr:unnamed protein product [Owenia fusiformis]
MNAYTCLVFVFVGIVAGGNERNSRWTHVRTVDSGFANGLEEKLKGIEQRLYRVEDKFKTISKTQEENLEQTKMYSKYAKINTEIVYKMTNNCDKERNHLRCLESGECIHELLACDGHVDCADGTDERDDVCNDSIFAPGLLYKAYIASGQTCFMDAKRVHFEFLYDKIIRRSHLPQAVFTTGNLIWRYERLNGSKVYESRDCNGTYLLGSGFEHVWTVEKEPVIFRAYIPYFIRETPARSYIYLGDNPIPCGWCTWVIPEEFDENVRAVYSNE